MPGGCTSTGRICTALPAAIDADGDGLPNHLDRDSDGDGLTDARESGGTDADGDGEPDGCASVDSSGVCQDAAGASLAVTAPRDTDGTDGPDYLDVDSDGDGIGDAVEAFDTNGDGTLGDGETQAAGEDTDADGIDDAFDADCVASDACAAVGSPVTDPLNDVEDADGDGVGDWLQTCGDAYVTGDEACDTGAARDTCSAMCRFTSGQPCDGNDQCDSGICGADTATCDPCTDTSTGGVDDGCTAALPACIVDSSSARCEACDDDQPGNGIDDGCTASAPLCNASHRCEPCTDCAPDASVPDAGMSDAGMSDAGASDAGPSDRAGRLSGSGLQCSMSHSRHGSRWAWMLALVALGWMMRRRRG